jgi:hypothetical protein
MKCKIRRPKCACGKVAAYYCCFPLRETINGIGEICSNTLCVEHSRGEPGVHWCEQQSKDGKTC